MSVLETPRIYFAGQISWDPIVTNNYPEFYDEAACDPVPAATSAQRFRERAIADVTGGNWNPHGTHRSSFFETEVSGVDLGRGVTSRDPFVGAPVDFTGMLVDCEPYGSTSSQLFFDALQFGIAGGCRIGCAREARAIARYINFARNPFNRMIAGVASVVWQTSFRKSSGLRLEARGSEAIAALDRALEDDDVLGLTVRWNSYRTVYYGDPTLRNGSPPTNAAAAELTARLKGGGFQPNPARSLVVGVLGLWRRGEPAQEPGDRALLSRVPAFTVGSAHARIAPRGLVLDFANSISEVDELRSKRNWGTLTVLAGKAPIARIPYRLYERSAYERTSGIITLPLDEAERAAAADADLSIVDGDGKPLLREQRLRAIPDDHNLYRDEGESSETTVRLLDRGRPAGAGIEVTAWGVDATPVAPAFSGTTGDDGLAKMTIPAAAGGSVLSYVFTAGEDAPAPAGVLPQTTTYMDVRTLPADEDVGALEASWDNVYRHVLLNWHAMAPCMDNWLRLDDEAQVRAYAQVLKKLTDPADFESFRHMPVTRDMTKGERKLLYRFLDGGGPSAVEGVTAAAAEDESAAAQVAAVRRLSAAMRSR